FGWQFAVSRNHPDWYSVANTDGPTALEKLPAGHDRHHQVEDDAVRTYHTHPVERFGTIACRLDTEAVQLQGLGNGLADSVVIVDDQDALWRSWTHVQTTVPFSASVLGRVYQRECRRLKV